jgi:hypothetical protein
MYGWNAPSNIIVTLIHVFKVKLISEYELDDLDEISLYIQGRPNRIRPGSDEEAKAEIQ